MLTMIAAMDPKGAIGKDGGLPWRNREEMRHFRNTTMDHTLIMGRVTFEGLGGPLKGRKFIVISRDPEYHYDHPDVTVCHDAAEVFEKCSEAEEEYFLAGGRRIYLIGLKYCDRLLISRMKQEYEADTYLELPELEEKFELTGTIDYTDFSVLDYRRKDGRCEK